MNRIAPLNSLLANQIAAGEVIERPASVVKELVENSLDAGADRIDLVLERGGSALIQVRDNGAGIHADDLELALRRHATSKIALPEDLEQVMTLGFRGEALASISSVAYVSILSAIANETGWQISSEGSNSAPRLSQAAHPRGTTIEVRDLFFNTPARKKFLRSEKTEFDHIDELVKRIALSAFSVNFTVKHNQKMVRQYRASSSEAEQLERVATLCGPAFAENAIGMSAEAAGLKLSGWLAQPVFSRAQPDLQYFYVNGRMVRDRTASHAVRAAYRDVMYGDRHPAYVLFLTIPPEQVDVNVHPAKHEVRFRDSRLVHDFIQRSVKDALESLAPGAAVSVSATNKQPAVPADNSRWGFPKGENRDSSPLVASRGLGPSSHRIKEGVPRSSAGTPGQQGLPLRVQEQMTNWQKLTAPLPEITQPVQTEIPPLGHALAQLKNIYILAENADGLVMVDMHAAHERVLYEQLKKQWTERRVIAQPLLVPLAVSLTEKEAACLETHADMLSQMGLRIERMGQDAVIVREVPDILREGLIEELVRDLAADLLMNETTEQFEAQIDEILGNIACRSAVHARKRMGVTEMNALLRAMENTPNSGYCNHGRPTTKQFSLAELDNIFLRGR